MKTKGINKGKTEGRIGSVMKIIGATLIIISVAYAQAVWNQEFTISQVEDISSYSTLNISEINTRIKQVHLTQQPCTLYIVPDTSSTPPGDSFQIDFSVKNVNDCYLWQIHLWWDASILHLKRVEEGPFLKQGGYSTIFVTNYDDTANGRVLFGCCRLGAVPGASGDGVLAYGHFSVKQSGETCLKMDTIIGGWETYLRNSNAQQIPCEIINGYFKYPLVGVEESGENYTAHDWCRVMIPSINHLQFTYYLPQSGRVRAKLYNSSGRLVLNLFDRFESAGEHQIRLKSLSQSGVYFLHLQTKDRVLIRKVVVMDK